MEKRGGAVIEITGNRSVTVDGCDGIVDYDEEKVMLRTGRLMLAVSGRGLKLKRLTDTSAVIEGVINTLEYMH